VIVTWPGWCSLEIPNGWTHEDRPDVVSVFREEGVGALQLSFAKRAQSEPSTPEAVEAIARSYAQQQKWRIEDAVIRSSTVDGSPCAEFEYVDVDGDESSYWQVWHILDEMRLVFITYVCEPGDEGKEHERTGMVASLKWS
jgi:hypothetical protein